MESDILRTLQEIRGILYVIGLFIALSMTFKIFESISLIIKNYKEAKESVWKNDAIAYFDKGDYKTLFTHCEERIKTHPNDATAVWWFARVNQVMGNNDKATELFQKVAEIEPSWKEEHVKPYIAE